MRSESIRRATESAKQGRLGPMEHSLIEAAVTVTDDEGRTLDCIGLDAARALAAQQDQVYERLRNFAMLVELFTREDSAGHMGYLHRQACIALDIPQEAIRITTTPEMLNPCPQCSEPEHSVLAICGPCGHAHIEGACKPPRGCSCGTAMLNRIWHLADCPYRHA